MRSKRAKEIKKLCKSLFPDEEDRAKNKRYYKALKKGYKSLPWDMRHLAMKSLKENAEIMEFSNETNKQ
tara:strand:+ start:23649 stop:23855 length:207 start_codon:yes stop_codon:yes gene_type:complete